MRKNWKILPIVGIATICASITPLVTITSCNNGQEPEEELVPIPEDKLWITEDDASFGVVFEGVKQDADLSKYNEIVLPDRVNCIRDNAFRSFNTANNCKITTVVMSKNLNKVINKAFNRCETVTKLDFSKCTKLDDEGLFAEQKLGKDSFSGLLGKQVGEIVSNNDLMSDMDLRNRLLQRAGLPGDWLQMSQWNGITWTSKWGSRIYERENAWKNVFAPVEFDSNPVSPDDAMKQYMTEVIETPSIFMDDFLYAYTNLVPLALNSEQTLTLSDVSGSINGNDVRVSYTLHFKVVQNQETVYDIEAKYTNMRLVMEKTEEFSRNPNVIKFTSWVEGASVSVSGSTPNRIIENFIIFDDTTLLVFWDEYGEELANMIYSKFQIPTSYYQDLELDVE